MLMLSFQMVKANQKMGGDVGRFASKVDEARRGHRSGSRLISFSSRVLHEKPVRWLLQTTNGLKDVWAVDTLSNSLVEQSWHRS